MVQSTFLVSFNYYTFRSQGYQRVIRIEMNKIYYYSTAGLNGSVSTMKML
jgi:hypothetical protein